VKTKNEKEHNAFVHDNTFACEYQRYTVLTSRIQKETKVN